VSQILSDEFKELVRSRTDIVGLIAENVGLQAQRGGRDFVGLCPFHEDHRPSFHVYPDRQSFRCWVCNEGGDCFSFVMRQERVDFREALEMLASRAQLELPAKFRAPGSQTPDNKSRLYEIMVWAEQEFHHCLLTSPAADRARQYLAERRLTEETIRQFRLGYHPAEWEWLQDRARGKYSQEQLATLRLIAPRENGQGYYDYFRDRVLFPIRDNRGRPVALGGRILPGAAENAGPKYFNSHEHPLFNKSSLLYGFDRARESICKTETAVVVEGYTDCILAHQHGVTNVVGTLGTALAETHVVALKRFARKVVLVYDGDAAGRAAAERSLPKFLAHEVDLRVLTLPGNVDPADYLVEQGAEAFNELLSESVEAWEQKLQATVARFGMDSIDSRSRVLQEMLGVLKLVRPQAGHGLAGTWQLREQVILGKLSQRLGIAEEIVRQQLQDLRSRPATESVMPDKQQAGAMPPDGHEPFPQKPSVSEQAERELLAILFRAPESVAEVRQQIVASDFTNLHLRELLELCFKVAEQGMAPSYERITAVLEDYRLKRLAALIDEHAQQVGITGELLSHTLGYFQRRRTLEQTARSLTDRLDRGERGPGLDQDAKLRLQRATELNQQRLTNRRLN